MRIEERRIVYGSTIGAGMFVVGVLLVWLLSPIEQVENLPDWRVAVWVFLDANGVVIESGYSIFLPADSTGSGLPTLQIGWVFPMLLVILGTILTVSGVSGTSRLRYMIENGSTVLYGYLGIGLVAFLESGARPAIAGLTGVVLFLVVSIYIGSRVTGKLIGGIPFLGIASLGLIIILGMIFVVAGYALLKAMLPMILIAVGGVLAGVVSLWSVRQAPR